MPRTYYLFALVLLVLLPDALLLNGNHLAHADRYLAIVLLALWRLARGGHITWWLLLAWNVFLAVVLASSAQSGDWSAGGPLLFASSVASLVLLLSPSMRRHVDPRSLLGRRRVSRA